MYAPLLAEYTHFGSPLARRLCVTSTLAELPLQHPANIRKQLGLARHVFMALLRVLKAAGLKPRRHVSAEEQLATFLYLCVTGISNQRSQYHLQRSGDTLSQYVLPFYSFHSD